jgi:outer membrane protein
MKITTKLSSIATAAAIISVMSACQDKGAAPSTTAKSETTTPVSASEKIVYVNSDSLLTKYQYFKDVQAKLQGKTKTAQQDMASKAQAYQREVAQYQAQANTLPADQRASTEERLGRKQQELQSYQQNAAAALQTEQATENEKLYDKIAEYLKTYAKKKGFKLVLSYSKANPTILFADESLDVTSEVIVGLNEAYKK